MTLQITKQKLYVGDSFSWLESPSGYLPSDGYTNLKVIIKYRDEPHKELTVAQEDDAWRVAYSLNNSVKLNPGIYTYQVTAVKNSEETTIGFGSIPILPGLISSQDSRTYWEQIRDAAKDAYQKLVSKTVVETTFNGRTYKFKDAAELLKIINNAEDRINYDTGAATSKIHKARFL